MVDFLKFPGNLGYLKCIILFHAFLLLCTAANAQIERKLSGTLIDDSLKEAVSGADVYIVADKDTLSTVSDNQGSFFFSGFKSSRISILVMRVGFKPFSKSYIYLPDQESMDLEPIMLRTESNLLDEVVINGRDKPIKLKKDTIEYNADFYQVSENDRVEDLLRQLPGVEVDLDGNVTAMGKPLLKLRVNGEDFFTNSVKDFIRQLPASMIDKLQIINDYGDEANFTGVKGDSQKMLNLVTKAGQNKGTFGNASISGGTDHRYSLQGNGNFWEGSKQIGVSSGSNNTDNDAGINTVTGAGVNYRDKLFNGITASASYNYAYTKNQSSQTSHIETVNPGGLISTNSLSESNSQNNSHNINFNIQSIADKSYFQASLGGSLVKKHLDGDINSYQTGLITQNLFNNTNSSTQTPNLTGNFAWARSFEKPGRSLSGGITFSSGINQSNESLGNKISYFDGQHNGQSIADSLVNQFVDRENRTNNLSADFRYSEPLRSDKDSLVKRNIDFSYFFSVNTTNNSLFTRTNNSSTTVIDSLSSLYSTSFIINRFAVSYRYQAKRLNYNLGITVQPTQLTGEQAGNAAAVNHVEVNVSPIINMSYNLSDYDNFAFVYTGVSTSPDFYQLQPVANVSNLQNIIYGNRNLRSGFTHSGNLSYQHTSEENASIFMVALNGSIIQDQVVSNITLVPDTLNTLKQVTRFLNANGAYSYGGTYSFSMPFFKNKFNAELKGSVDYVNMISYADSVLNTNKSLNYSQTLKLRMNQRKLILTGYATYNYSSNRYSVDLMRLRNIETWQFNVSGRVILSDGLSVTADVLKRINSGYSLNTPNPTLINFSMEKTMFKNKRGSITFHAYDLLNQGNNLIRSISDNSITDSQYNQITRYFLVGFNYRLESFGHK